MTALTTDEAVVRSSYPRVMPRDSRYFLERLFDTSPVASQTAATGRVQESPSVAGASGQRPAEKDAEAAENGSGVIAHEVGREQRC